ncbi:hypothetical protein LTR01_000838 [Friedmanniomyces endolithicus]|nr:hypothetical protein LTR01_000838 [Friedmanniomyces endolithicus]KAK0835897.1 hypothetical protein LTR73_000398 [Friedmanniomyces endolithicus]
MDLPGAQFPALATDKEAMAQPCLNKLPEELVSNIARRLDYDDITSLRLVCRTVEARTFHEFATEYFSAKGFIISADSLKVLCSIASNKRLRDYLRVIYIVTSLFSETVLSCGDGCSCAWKPTVRNAEAYRTYVKDQNNLKDTGDDKRMLVAAFQKLPKLAGLFVSDRPHHGECIEGAVTYGIRKINRRTSRSPLHSPHIDKRDKEYTRWCTHVWKITCLAVAESGKSTITRFGTHVDKTTDGLSVCQELKLGPKVIAGLTKALRNLKTLKLYVRGNTLIQKDGKRDPEASNSVITKFAGTMHAAPLEDLTLSYDMTPATGFTHLALMRSLDLSKLKKLSVDGVYMVGSSLVTVLSALSCIVDLQLSWTNLTKGTWVPVLQAIQKREHLEHLHLMWLQQAGRKVYFLAQRDVDDQDEEWADDGEGGFYDEDGFYDDEEDDDDDDLPDLEHAPGYGPPRAAKTGSSSAAAPPLTRVEADEDFGAPGYEGQGERGYYICIKGKDRLAKYLPVFIKEYSLGEDLEDPDGPNLPFPGMGFPGMGGPGGGPAGPAANAALNGMMNSIFGLPLPPLPPGYGNGNGHGGATAGAGGHGHGHGHGASHPHGAHHHHGANHGHGAGHGPPPPPGMGGGPGYPILTGSMMLVPPTPTGNGAAAASGPAPPPQSAGPASGSANAGAAVAAAAAAGAQADAGAYDFEAFFDEVEMDDDEREG